MFRANGTATYTAKVPDTITTWTASAFAVHKQAGVGVAKDLAKVHTYLTYIPAYVPYVGPVAQW